MKLGQPFIEWLLLTRSSKMLRWSLMDLSMGRVLKGIDDKMHTVKPRFWNTFPAKIYVINRFFAADQNS